MQPNVIVFRGDIDEESLLTAATLVTCNDTYIIANNKSKTFIENSWSFDVEAIFNFCAEQEVEEVLASYSLMGIGHSNEYFEVSVGTFKKLKFNTFNQTTPTTIYELNSSFQNNIEGFLKAVNLENDFNSKVKYFSSLLLSTKQKELELFLGKSSLSRSLITSKVSSKPSELLGIDEFKKLQECYNTLLNKYSKDAGVYLGNKVIGIEQYYKHSIARSGRFVEVDSYPVAYKYFSAFLFISSEEVVKTTNYTASYISLFRAFEVYCEGLLLSQNKAKIDTFIDDYGNSFLDCFQVLKKGNYIKPAGFGPKWRAIREARLTNTLPLNIVVGLDLHKKLRNVNALTHGDLLCTLEVYNEFKTIILQTIDYFETKFCQQTLNWTILKNNMSSQFIYNMLPIVGDMLIDSYCAPRVKLK